MISDIFPRVNRFKIAIGLTLIPMMLGGWGSVWGQEKSLKPGINKSFQNPDVDAFIRRFEIESREVYHNRDAIVNAMDLSPGMDAADIGAGTGFFSLLMAEKTGPEGTIFAVDIAQKFLDHIDRSSSQAGLKNIKTVLGKERSVNLPHESIDLAYICDTYHHFEYPFSMLESIHNALRPGGRLVIVDFERVKGISETWVLGHVRVGKGTVTDEVKDSGFELVKEDPFMEEQYFLVFRKR